MTLTDTALDDMRHELIRGVARNNRRRSRRKMAAIAPVAALGIAVGAVVRQGDNNPAYALTKLQDGTIRVEVFPEFDDVEALESSLRDVGLEAVVIRLRSDPSLEGVVEVSSHANEESGALAFENGEFLIDVGTVQGEVEILIYSATEAGDDYQAAASVFAPDQKLAGLHCAYPDEPLTTTDLEERARAAGIADLTWTVFGDVDAETGSVEAEDFEQRPEGVVTGAQMLNVDTLQVWVSAGDGRPAADTIVMSDGTHYRPVPVCTPELASSWE